MNKEKLILPISIILWAIIIWWSFLFIQINKQNSIEKQKQMEITFKEKELNIKKEEKNREYISKRKKECMELYKTESKKYNNTTSYEYTITSDICFIEYKDNKNNKIFYRSFEWNNTPVSYNIHNFSIEWWKKFLREFYNNISSKSLYSAYYSSSKKVDYNTFEKWYKDIEKININSIVIEDFFKKTFKIDIDITEWWKKKNYVVIKKLTMDASWNYSIVETKTISEK